jgi:hypothetical protein
MKKMQKLLKFPKTGEISEKTKNWKSNLEKKRLR